MLKLTRNSRILAEPNNQGFLEPIHSTEGSHRWRQRPTAAELGAWMRRRTDPNP